MRQKQMGFTLVEIAIVLVIIGLLLGGVLKGQELINSAKVKNLANDFRSVSTFVYAYQDKFRALPGDDAAANTHVNGTLAAAANRGNARIDGNWNSVNNTDESFLFWEHIRLANLATGPTALASTEYIPRNAEGGAIGITGTNPYTSGAGWTGNFFVCSTGIQGRFVRQIDTTIDDGNTTTGTLRVICQGVCANDGGAAPANLAVADDGNLYTVCSSF